VARSLDRKLLKKARLSEKELVAPSPAAAAPGSARAPARPGPAQRLAQLAAAPESPRVDARRGPGRPPGRCAPARPASAQPASHCTLAGAFRQGATLLLTRAALPTQGATGCLPCIGAGGELALARRTPRWTAAGRMCIAYVCMAEPFLWRAYSERWQEKAFTLPHADGYAGR